jgi:hypothetical protein
MTQMNWNRPNNGYEKEPWQKKWITSKPNYVKRPEFPDHKGHKVKLIESKSGPHKGQYKCLTCNLFLKWASADEIKQFGKRIY